MASNLIRNNSIVYGGGSTEIACSIAVEAAADRYPEVEHVCILLTHNLIYNGVVLTIIMILNFLFWQIGIFSIQFMCVL